MLYVKVSYKSFTFDGWPNKFYRLGINNLMCRLQKSMSQPSYTERVWWSYWAERQSRINLTVSEFRDQVKCIKPHTSFPNCGHCHHEQQNCKINVLKSCENVRGTTGGDGESLHENQCEFAIHRYRSHHWCCSGSNSRDY